MNWPRIARALHELADAIMDEKGVAPSNDHAKSLRPSAQRILIPNIELTELDRKRAEKALRDRGYSIREPASTPIEAITAEQLRIAIGEAVAAALSPERDTTSDIITREQAAKILRVHPSAVARYATHRGLPAMKLGSEWRFRRSEVLRWLEGQPIKPKARAPKKGVIDPAEGYVAAKRIIAAENTRKEKRRQETEAKRTENGVSAGDSVIPSD